MDRERDPIAELARLITQADPYGESAAADNRVRQETASERHDEPLGLPPAPQLPPDLNSPEQAHELDEYGQDAEAYEADNPPYASHEEYQTEVPRVRRRSLVLMIAMTGIALLGTAGAFDYREIFGGSVLPTPPPIITTSNEPNKIATASSEPRRPAGQVGSSSSLSHPSLRLSGQSFLTEAALEADLRRCAKPTSPLARGRCRGHRWPSMFRVPAYDPGIQHVIDLRAVLGPLLDLVEIAMVRDQRVVGLFGGSIPSSLASRY